MLVSRREMARSSSERRRPLFTGRNPPKKKASLGNPEPTSAVRTALGPGRTVTESPRSRQARMRRNPGSDIPGMPASVTSAMDLPPAISSTNAAVRETSLCSCKLSIGFLMLWWSRSTLEWRVSSAATRSASFKACRARSVMSCKFPIGVGTTVSKDVYQPSATSVVNLMAASLAATGIAWRSVV